MSDGLSNEDLIKTVREIRLRKDKIKKNEYVYFKTRYEHLYKMITDKELVFDEKSFLEMLEKRKEVLSGEKDIKSVSEQISTDFFQKYHPEFKK
tara:strand:+ start:2761 stop:3042 length:282 start_codon:yes stop_codon:yes gene_type:complete